MSSLSSGVICNAMCADKAVHIACLHFCIKALHTAFVPAFLRLSVHTWCGLQELTSFSAYSTRVRRSAAEKLQAALPNLQKLRLGQGAAPPPTHVA